MAIRVCPFTGGAWREREAYEFQAESRHIGPDAMFEAEDVIVSGDRAVVRWVYRKLRNGQPWHLRGVDVFTLRGERVAAKLAYVKG